MSVSTKKGPILDPGLCRCCRRIKKCRILTSEYTYMGQKEIYADMIMDCFGILLSHTDDNMKDSGVCATCVILIRQATEFKNQVLMCEEMFLQSKMEFHSDNTVDNFEEMKSKLDMKLRNMKEEVDQSNHGDDSMDHTDYCDQQYETPVKSPKQEQRDEKPPLLEQPPSDDEDNLPLIREKKKKDKPKKQRKKKIKIDKNDMTKQEPPPLESEDPKEVTERDLDYMAEENLLTIIEYSYVCPFKNRRNNYYCYYCKDYFPKPEDLRQHTSTHDTKPFQLLMGYKKMPKLDITRIDCRLCETKINDINTFKSHIDEIHGKKVYFEAPDKLLLYKLTWNNLVCVMCQDVFEDFNGLNNHMVDHFSNFTCHVCGMCFLEKPRLDAHLKRHKDDEKHTCEICGKTFKSNHYKDMHVDIVHKKKAIIRCPKCDECFMSYALKNKHLQDAHGQKRVYPCNLCDKVYNRQKTLTEHQRRNHQKVMKHQCEFCEQRFYLPSRLKEHMATHTGERNYRCEHCDKSYPRLKSLQYHIRTHTNDRRYRCHVCGQAFIQNASLKSHLKSHHPECDIEGCYF